MRKKILFICPFPFDLQAGQRLKYELQFLNFKKNGYDFDIDNFYSEKSYNFLYVKNYFFLKVITLIIGYLKRIKTIFKVKKYDIIYIHLWVTPFFGSFFEQIVRRFSKKVVYDIEDNLLNSKRNKINPFAYYFKSKKKVIFLLEKSDFIISSAPELNAFIKKNFNINANYIPPSFDLDKFQPKNIINKSKVTIGWTGTFSSLQYLEALKPMLIKLNRLINFKLLLITNFNFSFPEIDLEVIRWNKESEINDLSKIDIGLYPLPDDEEWVMGKSGLKALQYMAIGIPVVSSNIGNSKNFIKDRYNGFLVNDDSSWIECIKNLSDDYLLRKKIGYNAYETIKKDFSLDNISKRYLNIFNHLSQ